MIPSGGEVMEAVHEVACRHHKLGTKTAMAAKLGMSKQAYARLFTSGSMDKVLSAAVALGLFAQVSPDGRVSVWAPGVAPMVVSPAPT